MDWLMLLLLVGITLTATATAECACCGGFDCDGEGDLLATIDGFTPCPCRLTDAFVTAIVTASAGINGAFLLTKAPGEDFWRAEGATISISYYEGMSCSGDLIETFTYYQTLFIYCVDGVPKFETIFKLGGYGTAPNGPGEGGFFVENVVLDEALENLIQCGDLYSNTTVGGGTVFIEAA